MLLLNIVQLNPNGKLPTKAHTTDAAFDLYSCESFMLWPGETRLTRLGIGIDLPQGWYAEIHSRSGLAVKHNIFIPNGPGIIDAGYQGEIGVFLANFNRDNHSTAHRNDAYKIDAGDRIAQMIIRRVEPVTLGFTDRFLSDSERGANGFGSTGLSSNMVKRS